MTTVVVHEPVGIAIGLEQVDEQTVRFFGDSANRLVVLIEEIEVGVAPVSAANLEIVHVIRSHQDNQRLDTFAHTPDNVFHAVAEKVDRRAAASIVEPVRNDQQIGRTPVGLIVEHVGIEPLVRGRLAAILVWRAFRGDHIGADPHVEELYGHTLKFVDQPCQLRAPATLSTARPTAGSRAFAERQQGSKLLVPPVTLCHCYTPCSRVNRNAPAHHGGAVQT